MQLQERHVRFWLENASHLTITEFASRFDDEPDRIDQLLSAIEDERITADEFFNGDYLYNRRQGYYSSDKYRETCGGDIIHEDDASYCENCDDTLHSDDVYSVTTGRRNTQYWCEPCLDHEGYYWYEGERYTSDALSDNDLVIMCDGEVRHIDYAYWSERYQEYRYESDDEYVRGYHDSDICQSPVTFTKAPQYYVGLEIEKEDMDVLTSICIEDFEDMCPDWRKEHDGSLDSSSGYELVSPPLELCPDKILEHISANQTLVDHINAEYSSRCGGHIHLSEEGLDGKSLFKKIKGYVPLLHAMYPNRVEQRYCKAKSCDDLVRGYEKHQSVNVMNDRIEIRIFSAVRDMTNMHWRLRLLEAMLSKPTACPKVAFYNMHSHLRSILDEVYVGDKFATLSDRVIEMARQYDSVTLTKPE